MIKKMHNTLMNTLTYADDAALIDSIAEQATVRISAIAIGLSKLADMEISCGKTKCLFVQEQVETDTLFVEGNAEALEKVLQHKCEAWGRGFSTHQGLKTHEAIWCGWAEKLDTEKDYEIDLEEILEARGCPEYRFYLVKWKGYSAKKNSWIPALWAEGCAERVDDFWKKCGMCAHTTAIPDGVTVDRRKRNN